MSSLDAATVHDEPKKLSISLGNKALKRRSVVNVQTQEKVDEPRRIAVTSLSKDVMEELGSEKPIVVIPLIPNRQIRPSEQSEARSTNNETARTKSNDPSFIPSPHTQAESLEDKVRNLILKEATALIKGESLDTDDVERKAREGSIVIVAAADTSAGHLAAKKASQSEETCAIIGDDTTEKDYSKVAVEDFGYAMLRGMGWKSGQSRDTNKVKELPSNLGRFGLGLRPEDASLKEQLGLTKKRNAPSNTPRDNVQDNGGDFKKVKENTESDSRPNTQQSSERDTHIQQNMRPVIGSLPSALESGITKGLRVRIIDKNLEGGRFYCLKGSIAHISRSKRGCVYVEVDPDRDTSRSPRLEEVEIDNISTQLETVVPSVGGRVLILRGRYRDERATVVARNKQNSTLDVELEDRHHTLVRSLSYEDVCEYPSRS